MGRNRGQEALSRRNLVGLVAVQKPFNASGRVDELMLAGIKRMACAANLNPHLFFGRPGCKSISTVTKHRAHIVHGVNSLFHSERIVR